jgi:histone H3/H4
MVAKSVAKRHSKSYQKSQKDFILGAITPASIQRAMRLSGVVSSSKEAKMEARAAYLAILVELCKPTVTVTGLSCQKTLALKHLKAVLNSFGRRIYI